VPVLSNESLQKAIGYRFKQPQLLAQALVHSSFVNENPGVDSNERMEFLGDAVLDIVIAGELFRRLPGCNEGGLTALRSKLVCSGTLADIAGNIGLGGHLRMGKGEEAGGGRQKAANLASALEAVIAAIYLDDGLDEAGGVILRLFGPMLDNIGCEAVTDYKSRLQTVMQAKFKKAPIYITQETAGAGDEHVFVSEARLGDEFLGRGSGKNKKSAEADAARSALIAIEKDFTGA
jgi:ribonuclease-3